MPWYVMVQVLHTLQVPGRIEMLSVSPRFIVLVDYAHNAMALEALLTTLQDYHPGRIICIFGCGGNRSAERRFQMGEVAGRLADLVVVTTDNPRDEDPEKIADEICRVWTQRKENIAGFRIVEMLLPMESPMQNREILW